MSRFIKEKIVEMYEAKFRDVTDVAVVDVQGVGVLRMTALRRTLRASGIQAMRVHNRLGQRALSASGLKAVGPLLTGPSTLVWGGDSLVDVAKALVGEAKHLAEMEIRGGISAGRLLSKDQVEALSKLPSREELIGMAVGMAIGQAARVAAAAMAMGARLAAQIREVAGDAADDQAPAGGQETQEAKPAEAAEGQPAEPPADEKQEETDGAPQTPEAPKAENA